MKVDFVRAIAHDGLHLDGALHVVDASATDATVDAVLCLHGAGSNFYSSLLTDLASHFLDAGVDYALLLAWNYTEFFLANADFIKRGGKFIVPLPAPAIRP